MNLLIVLAFLAEVVSAPARGGTHFDEGVVFLGNDLDDNIALEREDQ